MHVLPGRNTRYDFKNKMLLPFLLKKLLIDYVDVLTSQSNCVILSVEDAKKTGRFKNNLTASSFQYQMGRNYSKDTRVGGHIYNICMIPWQKGFMWLRNTIRVGKTLPVVSYQQRRFSQSFFFFKKEKMGEKHEVGDRKEEMKEKAFAVRLPSCVPPTCWNGCQVKSEGLNPWSPWQFCLCVHMAKN